MTIRTRVSVHVILSSILVASAYPQGSVACPARTIAVSVLDHDGNLVTGIEPPEFRAEFRGRPLKILSSAVVSAPRRVVVLVDLSGSDSSVEEFIHRLASNMATSMQQDELRPALVLFSDHIIDTVDFSRPTLEVAQLLARLPQSRGRTALFDALKYATVVLGQPLPGDSVYLISDGAENASKAQRKDVETEFLARGIRIFSFSLGDNSSPRTQEEMSGPGLLSELADLTGGMVLHITLAPFPERLASELQRSYHQLSDFYELQLELPTEPIGKRSPWHLEVVNGQGKKRKDIRVIYPHQLVPCADASPAD